MKIRITLALAALLMQGAVVSAAEIKVLSAGASGRHSKSSFRSSSGRAATRSRLRS
jgi:hypothetical protein